jgi:hypothetical protein
MINNLPENESIDCFIMKSFTKVEYCYQEVSNK